MRALIFMLIAAIAALAAKAPMSTYMRPPNAGCDAACQAAIADSLSDNGVGPNATGILDGKVLISDGSALRVTGFGNSLLNFPGSPSGNYYDTLNHYFNFVPNNLAVAGSFYEDTNIIAKIHRFSPQFYDMILVEGSGNDVSGLIPAWKYTLVERSGLYWAAFPNNKKHYASEATTSGTWVQETVQGYALSYKRSETSGDYIEFREGGKWVALGLTMSNLGGAFSIYVNGVLYGNYTADMGGSMGSGGSVSIAPTAMRLGPFSADSNTIRIVNTENGKRTYLSWWYGKGDETLPGPFVVVAGGFSRPAYSVEKEALVIEYDDSTAVTINQMQEMGLNVEAYLDPSRLPGNSYYVDGIHLNALGAQLRAQRILPYMTNGNLRRITSQATTATKFNMQLRGTTHLDSVVFDSLTATTPLYLNASKQLRSGSFSGTGTTFALTASPAFTGTVTGAKSRFSDSVVSNMAFKVDNSTSSTPLRLVTSNASSTAAYMENTSSSSAWSFGVSGSGGSLAPSGAFYMRDALAGITKWHVTTAGTFVSVDSSRWNLGIRTGGLLVVGGTSTLAGMVKALDSVTAPWIRAGVISITPAAGSAQFNLNRENSTFSNSIMFKDGGTNKWSVGTNVGGAGADNLTFYSYGTSANVMTMDLSSGNVSVGATSAGGSAQKVLALTNTATAPTTSADLVHLFGANDAGGSAILGIWQETAPGADIGIASTHSALVKWNGAVYKIGLTLVP